MFLASTGLQASASVETSAHVRWNQDNWKTTPHPQISNFAVDEYGNAEGTLADGSTFRQYDIYFDGRTRVQKFELDDYHHFVVNDNIAYSLQELSILLHGTKQN